jgi:hypothetical protein
VKHGENPGIGTIVVVTREVAPGSRERSTLDGVLAVLVGFDGGQDERYRYLVGPLGSGRPVWVYAVEPYVAGQPVFALPQPQTWAEYC